MELTVDMLLNKRDYDNQAFTRKIIELFSDNLTKAVQMYYKYDRRIKWSTIERFPAIDNYIYIAGEVEIRVGDVLIVDQNEVLVDEQNISTFTRPIRYTLNSKILQHGTVEAIYQHVAFIEGLATNVSEGELIKILRSGAVSENVVLENPTLKPILDKITRPTSFEGFDTSTLDDYQFNTLRFCSKLSKTSQH